MACLDASLPHRIGRTRKGSPQRLDPLSRIALDGLRRLVAANGDAGEQRVWAKMDHFGVRGRAGLGFDPGDRCIDHQNHVGLWKMRRDVAANSVLPTCWQ